MGNRHYPSLYFAEVNVEDLRIPNDDNKRKFGVATFELENVRYADEGIRAPSIDDLRESCIESQHSKK